MSVLPDMSVTWETSHFEMSWLNALAPQNAAREEEEEKEREEEGRRKKEIKKSENIVRVQVT